MQHYLLAFCGPWLHGACGIHMGGELSMPLIWLKVPRLGHGRESIVARAEQLDESQII